MKKIQAYTDGAYSSKTGKCGYGVIFISPETGKIVRKRSGEVTQYRSTRNVTGECTAAEVAVEQALADGYDAIDIYYDYEGIEKWATGDWVARTDVAKDYEAFMDEAMFNIDISFHKIAAHTGVIFNEMADDLAKEATK